MALLAGAALAEAVLGAELASHSGWVEPASDALLAAPAQDPGASPECKGRIVASGRCLGRSAAGPQCLG